MRCLRHFFLVSLIVAVGNRPQAASLKVAPARFIVHNVEPGRLYDVYQDTGLPLTIFNDDEATATWLLSTHRPSERGRWEKGYSEIPDARWFWFENSQITIGPHRKAYAKMYLKVPDGEKYCNQHWVVTLGIGSPPGPGGIALAVDVRAQIETKSKGDVRVRPDGLLGLRPSTVCFAEARSGTTDKTEAVLYNNDETTHTYTITSLQNHGELESKVYLSHSYEAIPEARWMEHENAVRIPPGSSALLPLVLKIPGDAAGFGKKWEDILFVQPDQGLAGFLRVQVNPRKSARAEATGGEY